MTPTRYLQLLAVAVCFGALIVAQRTQVIQVGRAVAYANEEKNALGEEKRDLLGSLSRLSDQAAIAERIEKMGLDLQDPVALAKASATAESDSTRNRPSRRR